MLALVLISVTLLLIGGRDLGPVAAVRSGIGSVLGPVGDALAAVVRPIGDLFGGSDEEDLRSENDALLQRVAQLEQELAASESARAELDQLAADLNLEVLTSIDSVVARVVAGPVGNFDDGVQIDRGTDDGIKVGMPVVGGGGLYGRVVAAAPNRATVAVVTDPGFSVGVRVAGGAGLGIVTGQGEGGRARADSFDRSASLVEGDVLVTGGSSRSVFPPDIVVGRVLAVADDAVGLEKEAEVELVARPDTLRYVTVLLWEPPS